MATTTLKCIEFLPWNLRLCLYGDIRCPFGIDSLYGYITCQLGKRETTNSWPSDFYKARQKRPNEHKATKRFSFQKQVQKKGGHMEKPCPEVEQYLGHTRRWQGGKALSLPAAIPPAPPPRPAPPPPLWGWLTHCDPMNEIIANIISVPVLWVSPKHTHTNTHRQSIMVSMETVTKGTLIARGYGRLHQRPSHTSWMINVSERGDPHSFPARPQLRNDTSPFGRNSPLILVQTAQYKCLELSPFSKGV